MSTIDSKAPTALVTGGAVRIGRAIALALAERGYAVAVHYNQSRGEAEAVVLSVVFHFVSLPTDGAKLTIRGQKRQRCEPHAACAPCVTGVLSSRLLRRIQSRNFAGNRAHPARSGDADCDAR